MKILVIGSKGFIGSHVFDFFSCQLETECWGCDVITDYVSKNYFSIDPTNNDFNELFESIKFDVCINCSGAASVPDSIIHPFRDFSLNTLNVIKMLEAIRRYAERCKFINLSSAAVYGNPGALPIKETDDCNPISPYGIHKLFAEQLCKEYHGFFGLNTCSLRLFSAYGAGLKKQLLWDIYQKSLKSDRIELFGTGNETRDFIFIDDIVSAICTIIKSGVFDASVYNVANGIEVSIKEVAVELLAAISYAGEFRFTNDLRSGDPVNWKADIEKIKNIGFKPSYTLRQGIKKYVKWLKD